MDLPTSSQRNQGIHLCNKRYSTTEIVKRLVKTDLDVRRNGVVEILGE